MKRILTCTRLKRLLLTVFIAGAMVGLSGCATISFGLKKPIFLNMSESTASSTRFYLDGKEVTPVSKAYSSKVVGEANYGDYKVTTYSVTYKPAIMISPNKPYYTLTIDNARYGRKDVLLRRDLMQGYGVILWLDLYFSAGVGSVIDIASNGLLGLPEVDVDRVGTRTVLTK